MINIIKDWNHNRLRRKRNNVDPKFEKFVRDLDYDNLMDSNIFEYIKDEKKTQNDICCYSTYCGPDKNFSLKSNVTDIENVSYYFISNNENALSKVEKLGWEPIYINLPVIPDILVSSAQAKIAKALPHLFPQISNHIYSYYCDDKFGSIPRRVKDIIDSQSFNDACLYLSHSSYDGNILSEFSSAMRQNRYYYQRKKTIKYITNMLNNGLKLECNRMFATNNIIRNQNKEKTTLINTEWYKAINECGIECQISIDFIAQIFKDDFQSMDIKKYII